MSKPDRSHDDLRALYLKNAHDSQASTFDGFSTSEVAAYNRRTMFGENDEAFPTDDAWSRIVD